MLISRPASPVNFRTLDLNLLRVFDEVMLERNLTRAAGNLAMTQPAVSNALKRLRESLYDDLFVRVGYGVEPTPRALELWPAVSAALARLRQAMVVDEGFDPADSRENFVLATADATASLLVPHLVRQMERRAPGVSLCLRPLLTRDPRASLASGEYDVALGYFPVPIAEIDASRQQQGLPDTFAHQRLYHGEHFCVMRADHPLAQVELDLDTFCAARHLIVSPSGRPFGFVDESLAALGRRRRVVLTVNQYFTAGRVVVQSDLLTVLPRHFIDSTGLASSLCARRLPFDLPLVQVDMLWHHRHSSAPAHAWLRDQLAEAARLVFSEGPVPVEQLADATQ